MSAFPHPARASGAEPAAAWEDGLTARLDEAADAGAPERAFLRGGWFRAAADAYGGAHAATLSVARGGRTVLALPVVAIGPAALGLAAVPGCYWPFRGAPAAADADAADADALVAALRGRVRGLRYGPAPDGDPALALVANAARRAGWAVLARAVGDTWVFPLAQARADGAWPRNSTLRKNRFHEKHLREHGALGWEEACGADWPDAFDALAAVEAASWVGTDTDGRDAKFSRNRHGAFWRAAARDPRLRHMMRAALLSVDGRPAAFSFDLEAGGTAYAIANSYDPAYARHSPGKLLYTRNLLAASARGVERVDWGLGDSGYKQVIGAVQGPPLRDWLFVRPGWAGRLLARVPAGCWAAGPWRRGSGTWTRTAMNTGP